jgi:hypothetical protein
MDILTALPIANRDQQAIKLGDHIQRTSTTNGDIGLEVGPLILAIHLRYLVINHHFPEQNSRT